MRILVTGATGFIGRHLCRRLAAQGGDVHALARPASDVSILPPAVRVHRWDGDPAALAPLVAGVRPDLTFHLATLFRSEHRPEDVAPLVQANVGFATLLVDALTAALTTEGMTAGGTARLVNVGTGWQHVSGEGYDPACLYAATKQAFEAVLEFYVRARGLRRVTLKLTDCYGPDDPRPKLVPLLLRAARSGERLALSPGEQEIDLVHVDDVVDALVLAGERLIGDAGEAESYAVRSGRPVSLRRLVALMEASVGRSIAADWGARPYRAREVMRSWRGGTVLPGWRPAIDLETGLRRLAAEGAGGA